MSGNGRRPAARWLEPPVPPAGAAEALAAALPVPTALCRLLAVRGITDADEARRYLRPELAQLHDPRTLRDMDRAVDRLQRAIEMGETILVHGDYDVDGICSTALMTRSIRALGGTAVPFIPDRIADGYDLGDAGVAAALRVGARVVLTCDCGTSAVRPALALQEAGIDLIISDHHLPGGPLPEAYAVLNPQRADCASLDKGLAAVGVAFKLALALTRAMGGNENVVLNQLDLVALATVADVAPLTGENRIFVRCGLALMKETKNIGLAALIRASRLDEKPLTAGRLGFTLAPRLNALGRLGSALRGVELLLAADEATANGIARECEELNRRRQGMDQEILDHAHARLEALDWDDTWGIVLWGEDWHPGVIGIVASRVVERTGRPAVMVAVQDGVGKGSGRSIPRFDLHSALGECRELFQKFGGHKAAAGLTMDAAQLPAFAEQFNAVARSRLTADDLVPELRTDLLLSVDEADDEFEKMLRHLEPFGIGNPGPVFLARGVRLASNATKLGSTDGVKFRVETSRGPVEAVGWGMYSRAAELRAGNEIDLVYKVERNEYQGRAALQYTVVDFRRN